MIRVFKERCNMSEAHLSANAAAVGHETRDADVNKLAIFGLVLVAMVLFGFLVTEGLFRYVIKAENAKRQVSPFEDQNQIPPKPHLLVSEPADYQSYMEKQTKLLNSYGWVDPKQGKVRIPIDRAMALVLQKGLPTRPAGQVTPGVSAPIETPRGDFGPPPVGVKGPQMQ
jgi:hypothetical protein